jgi:hypothetical protein
MGPPDWFGIRLTVYYVSRYDQIHFKLYAAVDQDVSDLSAGAL